MTTPEQLRIVDASHESLHIRFVHRTEFRYSGSVGFDRHRLVLRPRETHYERLESFRITASPEASLYWYQDVFGNIIANADFTALADVLTIESEFVISKTPKERLMDSKTVPVDVDFPVFYSGIEEAAVALYRSSVYPPETEVIRRWVRSLDLLPASESRGPLFHDLAARIQDHVTYQRREVVGVQSPSQTIEIGSGSCRDTAVLMMEAARGLGYAARFVSGRRRQ